MDIVGALATGSLITLIVKTIIDRRNESRSQRRAFHVELLTLLTSRRRATQRISLDPAAEPPADIPDDRVDEFDAKLLIDSTPEVREIATRCFRSLQIFWSSYTMRAPIDVDRSQVAI